MIRLKICLFVTMSLFIFGSCSYKSTIVSDGKSNYKIYVSIKAIDSELFAAHELQKYLYKISGCQLDIVREMQGHEKLIYIGFEGAPSPLTAGLDLGEFKNEEYIIRSHGQNMLIAGGGSRGTLYGVLGYLSDHLGCRWYTRDVVKIPSIATITLPKIENRQSPQFEYREAWYLEAYDTQWALHNRLNPSIVPIPDSLGGSYITYPFVHTFYNLVAPDQYFKKHPEYFSEVAGKRIGKDGQLCLTNPDVVSIAMSTVFDWIKAHPHANVFSVDQNDGHGNCTCTPCKVLDEREGSPSGSIIHFVNQIADSVHKVYPHIKLQTLAYAYSEIPPKNLKPAENVIIRLCHYNYCSAHPLHACENHKPYLDRLMAWKKIAKNITIWDYYTDFAHYLMPFPNFETLKHDVKYYADQGVIGLFAQGNNVPDNGGGEFSELRAWVFSQLMWNPNRDGQKLIDEFITHVYGASAPYIQEYVQMLHEQVDSKDAYFSIWSEPTDVNYLNVSTIQKADSLFDLAIQASQKDTALQSRVELAYLPVLYTKLFFYTIGGTAYLSKKDLPASLTRFDQIIEKHRIKAIGDIPETYGNLQAFRKKVVSAGHFISGWKVMGPFADSPDRKGLVNAYGPEQSDVVQSFLGLDGKVLSWKEHDDHTSGYIDFVKILGPYENVVAYGKKTISLTEGKIKKFGVGSNDGVRVWINNKLVLDRPVSRKAEPNQDIITVNLPKGDHTVLVKVDQLKRAWGFYFTEIE